MNEYFNPDRLNAEELNDQYGYHANAPSMADCNAFGKEKNKPISIPKKMSKEDYLKLMATLNEKQQIYIMNLLYLLKTGKEKICHFIRGSSGVGKSHLIKAIYQSVVHYYKQDDDELELSDQDINLDDPNAKDTRKILCIIGAYTGKAAFNVRGDTTCRLFGIPFMGKFFNLAENRRKKMEDLYVNLQLIILTGGYVAG